MRSLKPQDLVVVLKLCTYEGPRPSIARIADQLDMSASEVHAAIQRARESHFLHGRELGERPNKEAIREFLVHGLKYVFPPQRGELTRGIPTAYAAEPLKHLIAGGDEPVPVWPSPEGKIRGMSFEPLYKTVPAAAMRDVRLYELLALADALRDGRSRERKIAEKELVTRLSKWSG
jgi:DNA-binding Lrp family transcriptional regulator